MLAKAVGNMAYDVTSSFIERLADDLWRQADADLKRGRPKLADKLYTASKALYTAKNAMDEAWEICRPHMK